MRILEHCRPEASPEIKAQIDTLREAFSEDTSKLFELKPSLGLRSPSVDNFPTPPEMQTGPPSASVHSTPVWSAVQGSSKNLTPTTEYSQPFDQVSSHPQMSFQQPHYAPSVQTTFTSASVQHQVPSSMQQGYALEPVVSNESVTPVWDPSGIFNQWNTAFGGQPAPPPPPPPVVPDLLLQQPSATGMPQQQLPVVGQHSAYTPQQVTSNTTPVPDAIPGLPPAVTPVMWQDAFTRSYITGHGHKRYRDDALEHDPYHAKRRG